jgi:hypothetical protein
MVTNKNTFVRGERMPMWKKFLIWLKAKIEKGRAEKTKSKTSS